MPLSDRHLRGVYGVRGPAGAQLYVTTAEFWRPTKGVGPLQLSLTPWLVWARGCQMLFDLQGALQALALGAAAACLTVGSPPAPQP